MNTKILGSPPSNDGSDSNNRLAKSFDLSTRLSSVEWDVTSIEQGTTENRAAQRSLETLGLFIVSQNIELVVDLLDVNVLGRSYPQNGYFDGTDFSAFDAYRLGMSRRHVLLKRYHGQLLIIDNKSTNGTYLNRALLQPLQPYVIQHNDQVRLGAFDLVIKLN